MLCMDNYDDDPLTLFEDALSNLLTNDRYEKGGSRKLNGTNLQHIY